MTLLSSRKIKEGIKKSICKTDKNILCSFCFFCILAPLPPGSIDKNQSNFHPEKLHLKWNVPINNTRVDSYYITISDQHSTIITSYPSSNDLKVTSKRFQPGTNYTVTLQARSYGSYSQQYTEEIQTLRKYTVFTY